MGADAECLPLNDAARVRMYVFNCGCHFLLLLLISFFVDGNESSIYSISTGKLFSDRIPQLQKSQQQSVIASK